MWNYTLVNFPFGKVELSEKEDTKKIPNDLKILKPKLIKKGFGEINLNKYRLWSLFEDIKDL